MIAHGDEIGRTQRGNNNVYCQDSELSWMDWSLVEKNADLLAFARKVTTLRKKHPVFRRRRFFEGEPIRSGDEVRDIAWLTPAGQEMTPRGLGRELRQVRRGVPQRRRHPAPNARGERVVDDSFLLCFNAHDEPVDFVTPHRRLRARVDRGAGHRRPRPATTDLVVAAGEKVTLHRALAAGTA